jgi:hypothetical protein
MEVTNQRVDRAVTRWAATAALLSATGRATDACNALTYAADQWGAKNRVLVAAPLYLRAALNCALVDSPEKSRMLQLARAAIPATLPTGHRLRRVLEHVERVAANNDAAAVARSQQLLAEQLNVAPVVSAHPALPGLFF